MPIKKEYNCGKMKESGSRLFKTIEDFIVI